MTFIPVPLTARVEMRFEHQGQHIENVMHVKKDTAWDLTDLGNLAVRFKDWYIANLATVQTHNCHLIGIVCTSLQTEFAPGIEYTDGMPFDGDIMTADLPMNVTLAVRFLTGVRGRSFRGRVYHCGLPAAFITASEVVEPHLTNIINTYDDLRGALESDGDNLVVVSYVSAGLARAEGLATVVTNVTAEKTLDSQRRRLPGRGN